VWWHYLVAIPAAALLANGLPHFIHGISGERFPTPFSGGAGTLDTPVRNVLWGGANLVVGMLLLWLIRAGKGNPLLIAELVIIYIGFAAALGYAFSHPERFGRKKG
jgi:hypothetical protein